MKKNRSTYFERYAYPDELLNDHPVPGNLGLIITIPCYKEPDILPTLNSINTCKLPPCDVEVIILINQCDKDDPQAREINQKSWRIANKWINQIKSPVNYHIVWKKDLPAKQAGVGLARKIAMDEAARRFQKAGKNLGIITGLDGDSIVEKNYMVEIVRSFREYDLQGASIYFEHPLDKAENKHMLTGIIEYELHLRYFILAQRFTGFPYAFHAVGSSIAVRNDIYMKQGGMNRRKAGEDFYFLHKIIPLGKFKEINTTSVFPSPRVSDRVPFGTGRAMLNWKNYNEDQYSTYHPSIFEDLKKFFTQVEDLYTADINKTDKFTALLPEPLQKFLEKEEYQDKIIRARKNSSSLITFRDQFFTWFDALKILKFVHYARDNYYENIPVISAYAWLAEKYGLINNNGMTSGEMLEEVRRYDKSHSYHYLKG